VHEPVEGEKDVDQEVFDDTDFYQALLREVVGSGDAANLNGGGAYASFNNVSKKKASATLDPKASKGRKIRYHVHEKLLSFMPPVPTNTWEKEQIDELFRGLLGGNAELEEQPAASSEAMEAGQQIRIF
jgi:protein AATF/BFR2